MNYLDCHQLKQTVIFLCVNAAYGRTTKMVKCLVAVYTDCTWT